MTLQSTLAHADDANRRCRKTSSRRRSDLRFLNVEQFDTIRVMRPSVMITVKIVLLLLFAIGPVTAVVLAFPFVSTLFVLGLVAAWLVAPSWGPWLYVGTCLGLMQWRAHLLYLSRMKMSVYVSSPSMAEQNTASVWLAVGAAVGGIRSFAGGDMTWAVLGGLLALTLFGLQGILFPSPVMISQACGYPMVSLTELQLLHRQPATLQLLLDKIDYPTLLRFKREARKSGGFGTDLARFLEEKEASDP